MTAPAHTDRFTGLRKLPDAPAARILAAGNVVLQTPLALPASAAVPEMLAALETEGALIDMLQVLAHALPPREATWLACLAARKTVAEGALMPAPLRAAEACGRSPHVLSVDVVELNPAHDRDGRTAVLAALTVWHVLRGVARREAG